MKVHEYQAKELFARYGIPVPPGTVVTSASEAEAVAARVGKPVVVKAQVLVGGRGKAGGVKIAKSPAEAREKASQILGMDIKGEKVQKVLVTEAVDIAREIYLAVIMDRRAQKPLIMASAEGGVEIEVTAKENPSAIQRVWVDPLYGVHPFAARRLAMALAGDAELAKPMADIIQKLYALYDQVDASLAEINPLVVTPDRRVLALDAKLNFDDNALYRHPDIAAMRDPDEEDPRETEAAKFDLQYIALDGDIGCMVNGAGLAMATMDAIQLSGGRPANFLDVGGGADEQKVAAAFKILLSDSKVKAVLVNIFGGIMKCDVIANGIVAAARQVGLKIPLVVRLEGTNVELGKEILAQSNLAIIPADDRGEAARKAVAAARAA